MQSGFFSRQTSAYTPNDVPAARHVADYVAVSVAHEQLVAAERDRAEVRRRSERLAGRVRALVDEGAVLPTDHRLVGRSDAWQRVLTRAMRVTPTDITVFLQGESGTGKEVVARFIHQASQRKDGPFVAINCAALPEQLFESELFGYERGAFTGAHLNVDTSPSCTHAPHSQSHARRHIACADAIFGRIPRSTRGALVASFRPWRNGDHAKSTGVMRPGDDLDRAAGEWWTAADTQSDAASIVCAGDDAGHRAP